MVLAFTTSLTLAQTNGSIAGEVKDEKQSVVTNATIIVAKRKNQ